MTQSNDDFDLSDLIQEGAKAKRRKVIERAVERTKAAEGQTPIVGGPPIKRDIYQLMDWKALSITLVTTESRCMNCASRHTTPNQHILIERYHHRHGRHFVEASTCNLMTEAEKEALPRKIETRTTLVPYCHHCFLTQEEICLTPQQTLMPQSPESATSYDNTLYVPEGMVVSSSPALWSDTYSAMIERTAKPSQPWTFGNPQPGKEND